MFLLIYITKSFFIYFIFLLLFRYLFISFYVDYMFRCWFQNSQLLILPRIGALNPFKKYHWIHILHIFVCPPKTTTTKKFYWNNLDLHKMSTSMYEVFNWGHVNESRPKRLSLFVGASDINIDDPPAPPPTTTTKSTQNTHYRPNGETFVFSL